MKIQNFCWSFSLASFITECCFYFGSHAGEHRHFVQRQEPLKVFLFFFLINFFFNFLIFIFWLRWVFVAARGLSLVAASGGYSSLWCAGFSLRWLLLLRSTGSRREGSVVVARGLSSCGSQALEHRLSSCGSRA